MNFPSANQSDCDLRASFHHLLSQLPINQTHAVNPVITQLSKLSEDALIAPLVYAWYREFTLENLNEAAESGLVKMGLERLGSGWPAWEPLVVGELSFVTPNHPTSPYTAEGWSMLLNEGSSGLLKVDSPTDEQLAKFETSAENALLLFSTIAPEEYLTWRDAMRMIVAVTQSPDSEISLAGGSSLFLPGVMVVNVDYCMDTLDTLATLVHEAAHVQLNSLCSHEPLCLNASDEGFTSPLRADARPMEGVIHANYVCARLSDLFLRISKNAQSTEPQAQAHKIAQDHYQPLASQVDQIRDHAKLTTAGKQILEYLQTVIKTCGELASP